MALVMTVIAAVAAGFFPMASAASEALMLLAVAFGAFFVWSFDKENDTAEVSHHTAR